MANPTGKGGFQERPQDINRNGAPKRGQSWQETVKRITDMDKEQLLEYVGGRKTRIGKLIASAPDNMPMKDAVVIASLVAYLMDPNAKMFAVLTDREEGKPNQPISGGGDPLEVVFRYAQNGNPAPSPAPKAGTNQDDPQET
jgi:hypothetical protein